MKIIAVTSGKGGTGKSCVAAYTGAALAKSGKKTLIAELGCDARSLDLILGVSDTSLFTIQDAASGVCSLKEAIAETNYQDGLHLAPCSPDPFAAPVDNSGLSAILKWLKVDFNYDYVIIDGADFSLVSPENMDIIINVANPETISVRASSMLTSTLNKAGAKEIRLVINNVPAQVLPIANVEDFDDVIDIVGARLLAIIPSSPKLKYSSNNTAVLADDSLTPKVFECVAARLEGDNRPLLIR